MTGAALAFGVVVRRRTAPTTFASMGELVDITANTVTREVKDATHHGSPDKYREFISGLRDGGEVALTLHYPVGGLHAAGAKTDFDADAPNDYEIELPAPFSEIVSLAGLITEIGPSTPLDDKMVYGVKIKVSGKPTWAAVAP